MSCQQITNITIAHVPNDRAVIALLLEYLQICKTRKICVMPDFKRNQLCYTAYIEVAEWCDQKAAYNLIQKIKDPTKEARIVYEDDNWWVVEETTEEELKYTQFEAFAQWTTKFKQIKDEVYDYEEKKQVSFKQGLQIEESISIEDLDMRIAIKSSDFNFDDFCVGFGLAHGYDFEAEYKEWSEEKLMEAVEKNLARLESKDAVEVLEMGF